MEINWHEWINLSDALQRAKASLEDWGTAGEAISHGLETAKLRAICKEFSAIASHKSFLNSDFAELAAQLHGDGPHELVLRRKAVDASFWPGASKDWGANSAVVDRGSVRFSLFGIRVNKVDLEKILCPEKHEISVVPRIVGKSALLEFLMTAADGKTREKSLRAQAIGHFVDQKITDDRWREAWSGVPDCQKLPRGRPKTPP